MFTPPPILQRPSGKAAWIPNGLGQHPRKISSIWWTGPVPVRPKHDRSMLAILHCLPHLWSRLHPTELPTHAPNPRLARLVPSSVAPQIPHPVDKTAPDAASCRSDNIYRSDTDLDGHIMICITPGRATAPPCGHHSEDPKGTDPQRRNH
jgi:hypothetical protein